MKTIITSGGRLSEGVFTDIDTLACAVAYDELLRLLKIKSEIVIVGPFNNTITRSIRRWKYTYSTTYIKKKDDIYVVVDCSNPKVFPEFINIEADDLVVWDHRFGYQDFWKKTKSRVIIEEVGACATLIWEEFKKSNLNYKISQISANLLYTAIFSNTLNFNASVTTKRDLKAFEELKEFIHLPENWIETYYIETEDQTMKNPNLAIKNDTKVIDLLERNTKITIGQIELWNSFEFVTRNQSVIKKVLLEFGNDEWFMTAPSISEGKNYIYTENQVVKDILGKILEVKFDGDLGVTSKLWLRKEILKKLLS